MECAGSPSSGSTDRSSALKRPASPGSGTVTSIAPDNFRGDFLDVKLWDADGRELASESLYVEDEE